MEVDESDKVSLKRESNEEEATQAKIPCLYKDIKSEEDHQTINNTDAEDNINLSLGENELWIEVTDITAKNRKVAAKSRTQTHALPNRQSTISMATKKHLQSQAKEIIAHVYHRMKYEAENGVEKLTDARWRTAQAVGVSESTITRILREERQAGTSNDTAENIFKSPKRPKRKRTKSELHDLDMDVLRRTIATFHTEFKELPTLRKLKQVLMERIGFNGCLETLRTILKESGCDWSKG